MKNKIFSSKMIISIPFPSLQILYPWKKRNNNNKINNLEGY